MRCRYPIMHNGCPTQAVNDDRLERAIVAGVVRALARATCSGATLLLSNDDVN
jgi:hypothetical protein